MLTMAKIPKTGNEGPGSKKVGCIFSFLDLKVLLNLSHGDKCSGAGIVV